MNLESSVVVYKNLALVRPALTFKIICMIYSGMYVNVTFTIK